MKLPKIRFSVRTLLLLVTLAAFALAAWPILENWATDDVAKFARNRTRNEFIAVTGEYLSKQSDRESALPTAICPYVVRVIHSDKGEMDVAKGRFAETYKYYVWFFGINLRLPFETKIHASG